MKKFVLSLLILGAFFLFSSKTLVQAQEIEMVPMTNLSCEGHFDENYILIKADLKNFDFTKANDRNKFIKNIANFDWMVTSFIERQNVAVVLLNGHGNASDIDVPSDLGAPYCNYIYYHTFSPNDPNFSSQFIFSNKLVLGDEEIGLLIDEAWDKTEKLVYNSQQDASQKRVSPGQLTVGLIDDGIFEDDWKNSDFQGVWWTPINGECRDFNGRFVKCGKQGLFLTPLVEEPFGDGDQQTKVEVGWVGSGSITSRIIGAIINNGHEVAGINNMNGKGEKLRLMIARVGAARLTNYSLISTAQAVASIHFLMQNNADIVNFPYMSDAYDFILNEAIGIWGKTNRLFVTGGAPYPCQYKNMTSQVVCVGSGSILYKGKNIKSENGKKIYTADSYKDIEVISYAQSYFDVYASDKFVSGRYYREGASVSTAYVTGVISLLKRFNIANARNNNDLLKCIIKNTGNVIINQSSDGGIINFLNIKNAVNFSGSLSDCENYQKKKEIRNVDQKIEVIKIDLAKKSNGYYDITAKVKIKPSMGRFDYFARYILISNSSGEFRRHAETTGRESSSDADSIIDIVFKDFDPVNIQMESSKHCVRVDMMPLGSNKRTDGDEFCLTGKQIEGEKESYVLSAWYDEGYEFQNCGNSSETKRKIVIQVESPRKSSSYKAKANLSISRAPKSCQISPNKFSPFSKRVFYNIFGKPEKIDLGNIEFKNGIYKIEKEIALNPIAPFKISASIDEGDGKEKLAEFELNIDNTDESYGDTIDSHCSFGGMHFFKDFDCTGQLNVASTELKPANYIYYLSLSPPESRKEQMNVVELYFALSDGVKLVKLEKAAGDISEDLSIESKTILNEKTNYVKMFKNPESWGWGLKFYFEVDMSKMNKDGVDYLVKPYPLSYYQMNNGAGQQLQYPIFMPFSIEDYKDPFKDRILSVGKPLAGQSPYKIVTNEISGTQKNIFSAKVQPIASSKEYSGWFEFYFEKYPDNIVRIKADLKKDGTFIYESKDMKLPDEKYCVRAGIQGKLLWVPADNFKCSK